MTKTYVTRPYFPSREKFISYIDEIWANRQLTNYGPLHDRLENKLKSFLNVEDIRLVTNGTLALQLALRALDVTEGEVITTPFSYVATVSSILWERCTPVFVDIDPETFCIDPTKIESCITPKTKAILAVHVFGYPCDVGRIEALGKKHNLKVIYDGAHAFGCWYNDRALLDYGDIATCSFHATKVFHTIEGGCLVSHSTDISKKIFLLRSFGHIGDDHIELGINAKSSEIQAAMGLCNLEAFEDIVAARRKVSEIYDQSLPLDRLQRPVMPDGFEYNYSYYPVVFDTEEECKRCIRELEEKDIIPRRYFYPSLNTLPYLEKRISCPVSEKISSCILSLPIYHDLDHEVVRQISAIITKSLEKTQ